MAQYSVGHVSTMYILYCICVHMYTLHECIVQYTSQETLQNPTNSAEILRRFRKDSVQLTAEVQYYSRRECLPCPRNDTSLSMDLSFQS